MMPRITAISRGLRSALCCGTANNTNDLEPQDRLASAQRSDHPLPEPAPVVPAGNGMAAPTRPPSPVHRASAGSGFRSALLSAVEPGPEQAAVIVHSNSPGVPGNGPTEIPLPASATSSHLSFGSSSTPSVQRPAADSRPATPERIESILGKNWTEWKDSEQKNALASIRVDVEMRKRHATSIGSIQADLIHTLEKLVRLKEQIKDGAMDEWNETALSVLDENTVGKMAYAPSSGEQIGRISFLLSMEDEVRHPARLVELFSALDNAIERLTRGGDKGNKRQNLSENAVAKLATLATAQVLTPEQTIKACELIGSNLHALSAESLVELDSQLAELELAAPGSSVLESLQERLAHLSLFNYKMLDEADQKKALEIFRSDVNTQKAESRPSEIQDYLLQKLESLAKAKKDIRPGALPDWYKTALAIFDAEMTKQLVPRHSITFYVNSCLHLLKNEKCDNSLHAADLIALYGVWDKLLDVGAHVFRSRHFLHATHLTRIADMASAPGLNMQQVELACQLIDKNVYTVSDEVAASLLEKLNGIDSDCASLQKLKDRLQSFPSKKIPQVISLIWHGDQFPMETIDNLIRLRKLNPDFKLRVYADSKDVVDTALSKWITSRPTGSGDFNRRYNDVQALKADKEKFEVRNHSDILDEPSIRKNYPRLSAYVERFGTKTRTKPNYALISDIERYACLMEGGWYIDCNVSPQAPIASGARAEAGIAMNLDLAGETDLTSNNYIVGSHPESKVIEEILERIHTEFDNRGEQVHPRLRAFHKYKPVNFDQRIGDVPPGEEKQWEPATMQLTRFSYWGPHLDAPSNFLNISRALGTMFYTGPKLIASVFASYSEKNFLSSYPEGSLEYAAAFRDIQTKIGAFASGFQKAAVSVPASWARGVPKPNGTAGETAFPVLNDVTADRDAKSFTSKLLKEARSMNRTTLQTLDRRDVESLVSKLVNQEDFSKHDLDLMKYHIAKGNMGLETRVSSSPSLDGAEFLTLGQAIENLLARHPEHGVNKLMLWLDALNRHRAMPAGR